MATSETTSPSTEIERYTYDVVVIGAGGSGLRAAIEARARGLKTAIIS
ncbi:MAG TPA: FAD-binding protein, partial [Trebonia sp.]|nr:FAD-binding protein [Trebonia sp.]